MPIDANTTTWRGVFNKVISDLAKLPRDARRIDIEVSVWRSVGRHATAAGSEEIAEITWRLLRRLSEERQSAA
jgi:hypothetical protein